MTASDQNLRLELVAGPTVELPAIAAESGAEIIVGRSHQCGLALMEETVSRHHASISWRRQRWVISDLGSRHGTFLNGVRLQSEQIAELVDGDLVRIGPWTLRVHLGEHRTTYASTVDDTARASGRIEPVRVEHTVRLAQHRLNLLIDCAAAITSAANEKALADAVVESSLAGSGFERAAMIRTHAGSEEVEILAHQTRSGSGSKGTSDQFTFSRSLVRAASSGQMARLASDMAEAPLGASVMELGITAALCAPIMLGESVAAFLYLDLRNAGSAKGGAAPDAASFCQAVARLCGLALSSLKRVDLERRQAKLEHEVKAARAAQILILPPEQGEVGPLRYAMRVRPGRYVAGDLFEAIELDDHRAAICIGDVAGHGIAAGVLMAAAQAHLHAALLRDGDPAQAVNAVNRFIAHRTHSAKFISMWVGVFDLEDRALTFVDAGHGYWMHKPADAEACRVNYEGGIPVGIDGGFVYKAERMTLGPRDRLILYSDGVIEQRNPEGKQFSHERVAQFISHDVAPDDDVMAVIKAVEDFAARTELDDDTTVASIEWKQ